MVILQTRVTPLVVEDEVEHFMKIVKAGFSEKRKKIKTSLANSLHMSKSTTEALLLQANISPDARAQDLSIDDWHKLSGII